MIPNNIKDLKNIDKLIEALSSPKSNTQEDIF